jgi:2-aminobenzoate-CoA ligase
MATKSAHVDAFTKDNLPPTDEWPEFRFNLPELNYPARLNCATELMEKAIREGHGNRIAIHSAVGDWTYEALNRKANQFVNLLTERLGLLPGNRVLLRAANNPLLAAAWFGVLKAGGVAVTTMPMPGPKSWRPSQRKRKFRMRSVTFG